MERSGVAVKSGREYDHLFPKAEGETIIINREATVEDTLNLIKKTLHLTLKDTERIAKVLKGRTLDETCSNIWHFVFDHIKYQRDERGKEQVRRPARTWANRHTGVDCDCMTAFISSILTNLKIPHKNRIAMYKYERGWQHIYPVVPKDGRLNSKLKDREDYIVIDCVKYDYDSEEPYLEFKDYAMTLEYLNGAEEEDGIYEIPPITDIQDLAAASDDEEELGRIGQWVKKAAKNVGKTVKKVGDAAGKGIRAVNRYANPGTILLRNGFLLAMKINMKNVAGRLRYAYLSDAQARTMNIDINELNKLRRIKDRAETIYWQAGGKKENLRKAILEGKGNKDRKVPLTLAGFEGHEEGEDQDAEMILMYGTVEGELGEPASATALAAAAGTVAAVAAALSQVKGLFKKESPEARSFASESEEAISTSSYQAPVNYSSQRTINFNPNITPAYADSNEEGQKKGGFMSNSLTWVKANPGMSLLVAGAIATGTYLLLKKKKAGSTARSSGGNLSGVSSQGKKRKKKTVKRRKKMRAIKI